MLAERDHFDLRDKTVGIIGVGNVGGRLAQRLSAWGSKHYCVILPAREVETQETFYL